MAEKVLRRENMYFGNLILVNKEYPIKKRFEKSISLIPADFEYPSVFMESKAASVLTHVFDEICSRDIVPVSGYRTLSEQEQIWEDSLDENGMDFTRKYVALPNHSEHQTGLAIDLGLKSENIDFIRPDFPYEGVCNDFRKKAAGYGFVERYQKEKEHITGIAHEPWHFRYVGYPHSVIMGRYEMCLEEYIEKLREYPYEGKHFCYWHNGHEMEICFVPMESEEKIINLADNAIYQISGNNVDGFIITMWRKGYGN